MLDTYREPVDGMFHVIYDTYKVKDTSSRTYLTVFLSSGQQNDVILFVQLVLKMVSM